MTADKLYNVVKMMFVGNNTARFDMTLVQFLKYLQSLLDEDKLEVIDGLYRLRK